MINASATLARRGRPPGRGRATGSASPRRWPSSPHAPKPSARRRRRTSAEALRPRTLGAERPPARPERREWQRRRRGRHADDGDAPGRAAGERQRRDGAEDGDSVAALRGRRPPPQRRQRGARARVALHAEGGARAVPRARSSPPLRAAARAAARGPHSHARATLAARATPATAAPPPSPPRRATGTLPCASPLLRRPRAAASR